MPNYYGYQSKRNSNSAQHGLFKYIKREKVNGKWKYWYEDAKKNINNFVDKHITGETAKKRSAQATTNAQTSRTAADNLTGQFKKEMSGYTSQQQATRNQLVSDTKGVQERVANKNYAAVHLPGHSDKANANLVEARNTRNTNLDKNKQAEQQLGSKAADTARRIKTLNDNAKQYDEDAKKWENEYNKTLAGRLETASKKGKAAAEDAADWMEDTIESASKKAKQAIDNGAKWVSDLFSGKKKKKKKK